MVELLVNRGAWVSAVDQQGTLPSAAAKINGRERLFRLLSGLEDPLVSGQSPGNSPIWIINHPSHTTTTYQRHPPPPTLYVAVASAAIEVERKVERNRIHI